MSIDINQLEKTDERKSFFIKGEKQVLDIYKIPLDELKYNVQNGRIASHISEYEDKYGSLPENTEKINEAIEELIITSNEDAFKKTLNNFKVVGEQTEPAVVLMDGTVIDGNRRFTILRNLSRNGQGAQFNYLKAAVLDGDKYTKKEIKTLELNLQHAKEERVNYNPVDKLVDIYRDLIKDGGQFTPEEYANETDQKTSQVKKDMQVAQLMIDYLNFINQPYKFHIVRTQKLDGPLREINKIITKKSVQEDRDDIQELLFTNLLGLNGDVTRQIRDMGKVIEKPDMRDDLLEETEDLVDDLHDYLREDDNANEIASTGVINIPKQWQESIRETHKDYTEDSAFADAKEEPLKKIEDALKRLEKIDLDIIQHMDDDLKGEALSVLFKIKAEVNKIRDILDVD